MSALNQEQWDVFLSHYPDAHILQTSQWGVFKQAYGWRPVYIANRDAGAQILFRTLPFRKTVAYIPKGPVGEDWRDLLPEIMDTCKKQRAIVIYIEPDAWEERRPGFSESLPGFVPSAISIQPRRTITLDLQGGEQNWLERMKQKTRYNIRLAEKKGVIVQKSSDIDAFNTLMKETGDRDRFGVHQAAYYRSVYEIFHPAGACEMFLAAHAGQPLAALMVFKRGKRAWYFYGASNEHERNRMPTYLLQWEAMRWAAEAGCTEYDLWGVPDHAEDFLEKNFSERSDGLWGVYRFKRGFGGQLRRSAGVFEQILQPGFYRIYDAARKMRKQGFSG